MKKMYFTWLTLVLIATAATGAFGQPLTGKILGPGTKDLSWRNSTTPAIIFKANAKVSTRLKAVHALNRNLNAEEINAFCQFIKALPDGQEKNLPALQLIKNDLLNALMEQSSPPAQLSGLLIEIYKDAAQDVVIRDYAIQHLITWYEQGPSGGNEKIRKTLTEAAGEDTFIGGTALLGLHRLAAEDTSIDRGEIKTRALSMAGCAQAALAARITAVQVCAGEGAVEALPLIRVLALASNPTSMRISAIAALGKLGDAQDIVTLEQMKLDPDRGLRVAVEAALQQLRREYHMQKVVLNQNWQ